MVGRMEKQPPTYRTTFFFVASMLAGFVIGWFWMLLLVLRRY